ncbi:MAG: hypothetical protein CMP56_01700 [Flavobacteriales bacterium]|nr:hypothetical protein [Flavobacteriales bacterium]
MLNEGCYDYYENEMLEPVTVGSYNPETNLYNTIIEIPNVRFASDLIIDGDFFYVAADNKILKYDLDTYELLNSVDQEGVRKLVIYENLLFASRGEYNSATFGPVIFDSYLEVYLKDNLNYYSSFSIENGPQWSTESLLITDNKLYVAVNNAYEWGNYKGIVGVIDLSTMAYTEIELGENGKNPINMMYRDNNIYTVNNKNWDGSSISIINVNSSDIQTMDLSDVSAGCGVSIIRDNKLNYQKSNETELNILDLETLEPSGVEENLEYNYYGIASNPLNGYLYAAIANFTSNSGVVIYDENNNQVNSFFADVATSKIVFDVRNENVSISPENLDNKTVLNVFDVLGRSVDQENPISIEILEDGACNKKMIIK